MSADSNTQEELKAFLGESEEETVEETLDNGIIEDQDTEVEEEVTDGDEETEDQTDAGEDQNDEEGEEEGEEDTVGGEDAGGEETDVEDAPDGTSESQQERYLKIIETLAEERKGEKVAPAAMPSIYDGEEFKGLVEVLDLDANEAKVLTAFMKAMQNDTQQRSVEQAMKDTPEVVGKYVNRQAVITKMKEKFYEDNPNLVEIKPYVAQVANTVSAKNSDWTMEQVLTETAKVTYKALGIKKELAKKTDKPGKRKKPAFAKGTKGGRKPAPKKSKLESDMQAMLDLDN